MNEDQVGCFESRPLRPGETEVENRNPQLVLALDTRGDIEDILAKAVSCAGFVISADGGLVQVVMPDDWAELVAEYGPVARLAVLNMDSGHWIGVLGVGEGWCRESLLEFLRGASWVA